MSLSEADFRTDFFGDLKKWYPKTHIFTLSDPYKHGYSDRFITHESNSWAIEAKFVKKLPVRETSNVLSGHDLSEAQRRFLERNSMAGGYSVVLVGFHLEQFGGVTETAIAVPWEEFKKSGTLTMAFMKTLPRELWFTKIRTVGWDAVAFFQKVLKYGYGR